MPATIKCKKENKKEITEFLQKELVNLLDMISEEEYTVFVDETDDGLKVEFPYGEIYGYIGDYSYAVADAFKRLKEKYNDIAVEGLVYAYETIVCFTSGLYFYCKEEDPELTITADWQECAVCGRIVVGEAFYNSSQYDFEEGNLSCLCSPTCLLSYCCDITNDYVEPNSSFNEDELEGMYDDDFTDNLVQDALEIRLYENCNSYLEDFKKNKEKIIAIRDVFRNSCCEYCDHNEECDREDCKYGEDDGMLDFLDAMINLI
jgi:hypothetical protein